MSRTIPVVAILLAGFVLAACAATGEGLTRADTAGVTHVKIERGLGADGTPYIESIDWTTGSEKDWIEVVVKLADGTAFTYRAGNVRAFKGQALRADVHKAMLAAQVEGGSAVLDAVMGVVETYFGLGVLRALEPALEE